MNPLKEQIKNLRKILRLQQQQTLDKHEEVKRKDLEIEMLCLLNTSLNYIIHSRSYQGMDSAPKNINLILKGKDNIPHIGSWDSFRKIWSFSGLMIEPIKWAHVPMEVSQNEQ